MSATQQQVKAIQALLNPILDKSRISRAAFIGGDFNLSNQISVLYSLEGLDYITEIRPWARLSSRLLNSYISYVSSGEVVPYKPWTALELLAREAE